MPCINLALASAVYAAAERAAVECHRVSHAGITASFLALNRLMSRLGDLREDDYWIPILRCLRRYRYRLASLPLPFNSPLVLDEVALLEARRSVARCSLIFPGYAQDAGALLASFEALAKSTDNPLLDKIKSLVRPHASTAIALKERKTADTLQSICRRDGILAHIEVVAPGDLRGGRCFDHLVVVGAASWFEDYILAAPRASKIDIVRYSCIRDAWRPQSVLMDGITGRRLPPISLEPPSAYGIAAHDFQPSVELSSVVRIVRNSSDEGSWNDDVPVRVAALAGEWAVFLERDDTSTVLTLDIDGDESDLERVPASAVGAGTYVVLRTEGGGDYIIPLADRILGDQAATLRATQRAWKDLLRDRVRQSDLLRVCLELLDRGSRRADEQNLRNWMSPRSIQTQDPADFEAIMRLIGWESIATETWNAMTTIRRAHRLAGNQIRRQLLEKVRAADLGELERQGWMQFELDDADGGSLTVFRVEQILDESMSVPVSWVGHPFPIEEAARPR